MGECQQQKHTQHVPSMKTECDYLYGWNKKRSHTQKSHAQKKVNPRAIAGITEEVEKEEEEEEEEEEEMFTVDKYNKNKGNFSFIKTNA